MPPPTVSHIISPGTARIDTKPPLRWEPKKWPSVAALLKLVLTGWGPDMTTLPTEDWTDKKKGALTRAQWRLLVGRIPANYNDNPYFEVTDNELPLEIVPLNDFLVDFPGIQNSTCMHYLLFH